MPKRIEEKTTEISIGGKPVVSRKTTRITEIGIGEKPDRKTRLAPIKKRRIPVIPKELSKEYERVESALFGRLQTTLGSKKTADSFDSGRMGKDIPTKEVLEKLLEKMTIEEIGKRFATEYLTENLEIEDGVELTTRHLRAILEGEKKWIFRQR